MLSKSKKAKKKSKRYRLCLLSSIGLKRKIRELNRLRKRKSNESFKTLKSDFQYNILYLKNRNSFVDFINKNLNYNSPIKNIVLAPKNLSFIDDNDATILFFDELNMSLYKTVRNTVINFKNCQNIDIASLTLIQIYIINFNEFSNKFNHNQFCKLNKIINIIESDFIQTNKALFASELISEFKNMNSINDSKFLSMGLKYGTKSKKQFTENIKGRICKDVQRFVNTTIKASNLELNNWGKKYIENLMGEILGNAEDHSSLNRFFVNGISFQEEDNSTISPVIQLNLSIINFGDSIYNGFMKTAKKNINIHNKLEDFYSVHSLQFNELENNHFTKESLFTLYSLQEGISRIKYLDSSRGNGTMNFIRAFINLGQFDESKSEFKSVLQIISGKAIIQCNKEFQPYEVVTEKKNIVYQLSLNKQKDLRIIPEKNSIFANNKSFPGTILQVKIYMSKNNFIETELNDNGENDY